MFLRILKLAVRTPVAVLLSPIKLLNFIISSLLRPRQRQSLLSSTINQAPSTSEPSTHHRSLIHEDWISQAAERQEVKPIEKSTFGEEHSSLTTKKDLLCSTLLDRAQTAPNQSHSYARQLP